MKKSLILLVLAGLFIGATSCRTKKDEPKPTPEVPAPTPDPGTNPTPGTNPAPTPTPIPAPPTPVNGDNNNTIKPDESPVNATVSIKLTKGARVTIKSDKPLTITGAKLTETQHTYEVTNESGFGIDGDPETLDLSIAQATEFALDKEMPSLKSLKITTEESLKKLSLQGAKNLEQLNIIGAQAGEQVLDLSKHGKLRLLALGNRPEEIGKFSLPIASEFESFKLADRNKRTTTNFKEVSLPPSLEVLSLSCAYPTLTGADNLPNLRAAYLYTIDAPKLGDLAFAGSPNLERLMLTYISGNNPLKSLTIKGKPHLTDLYIFVMKIDILSCDGLTSKTTIALKANHRFTTLNIHRSSANSIYRLLAISGDGLRAADLTNNPDLTEEKLLNIAKLLKNGRSVSLKIEEAKATEAVKEAFQKIGWTVNK
ncbi:hypothetical protein [Porphyromonas sp.]